MEGVCLWSPPLKQDKNQGPIVSHSSMKATCSNPAHRNHTPPPKGKDAFQKAKDEIATINWDKVLKRLGKDGADWEYNNSGQALLGLKCRNMTVEARLWFQILSNYVMPSTHGLKATLEVVLLISCVLDGQHVDLPRLIRDSTWKVIQNGNLPFLSMITQMATNVEVPWRFGNEQPKLPKKDKFIPYGKWYKLEEPSTQKEQGSASTSNSLEPPHMPLHHPVQQLIQNVDHKEQHLKCQESRHKRRYENIKRMNKDWDLSLEEPDTPEGAEEDSDDENSAATDIDSVNASDDDEE
ncbi:hypothetical protein PIB30_019034 [Stylosanthes scabra]|uniref:Putative plant transposon protein domain-containing protein n=1 Tax=Stylosanthes scabra TaxID=79078 RepID=A0ABU6S875_9FABA|nr:hypothetical protein [Stylosanthes scabra]